MRRYWESKPARAGSTDLFATAPKAWRDGPRVRIDTLGPGDTFTSMSGEHWTYVRRDGVNHGVIRVLRDDGQKNLFAGCAEVIR